MAGSTSAAGRAESSQGALRKTPNLFSRRDGTSWRSTTSRRTGITLVRGGGRSPAAAQRVALAEGRLGSQVYFQCRKFALQTEPGFAAFQTSFHTVSVVVCCSPHMLSFSFHIAYLCSDVLDVLLTRGVLCVGRNTVWFRSPFFPHNFVCAISSSPFALRNRLCPLSELFAALWMPLPVTPDTARLSQVSPCIASVFFQLLPTLH